MKYVFFDTETTSLDLVDKISKDTNKIVKLKNAAEVIQFAGFITDDNFRIVDGFNLYCSTTELISEGAKNVHHITDELCNKLSKGMFLEDWLSNKKYHWLLSDPDICFVSYNIDFDKTVINQTLKKHGYEPVNFGRELTCLPKINTRGRFNMCMMKATKKALGSFKFLKLSEVVSKTVKATEREIEEQFKRACETLKIPNSSGVYHDALYDTYCMILVLYANLRYYCR